MCQAFYARNGLCSISLRPTYTYQPGHNQPHVRRDIPDEIRDRQLAQDYWSFVDARDVAEAVVLSLAIPASGHQAFLLSSDTTQSRTPTRQLAERYYPHLPWRQDPDEYLRDNPYRSLLDCSLAKQLLNWKPKHSQREEILGK